MGAAREEKECRNGAALAALERLFAGTLAAAELQQLREHSEVCRSCAEACSRIQDFQYALGGSEAKTVWNGTLLSENQEPEAILKSSVLRWAPLVGAAASLSLMVAIVWLPTTADEYRARGGEREAFGIRGFCVDLKEAAVIGEALPGQKLRCPYGSALQLTYTSPANTQLEVEVRAGGEPTEKLFPEANDPGNLAQGTDVPLSFSTGVNASWLSGPSVLVAKFADRKTGKVVAESRIALEP